MSRPVPYWCPRCGETVMSNLFDDHRLARCLGVDQFASGPAPSMTEPEQTGENRGV